MAELLRDLLVERLQTDLVGPSAPDEVLKARPSDVYLTGILYPQQTPFGQEEEETLATESGAGEGSADSEQSPIERSTRPSAAGLSFAAKGAGSGPKVRVRVSCGKYYPSDFDSSGPRSKEGLPSRPPQRVSEWKRKGFDFAVPVVLKGPFSPIELEDYGLEESSLYLQVSDWNDAKLVTVVLINDSKSGKGTTRDDLEQKMLFQVMLSVTPEEGTTLVGRPSRITANDEDSRAASLLYRDAVEFATGHTCSAEWAAAGGHLSVEQVHTSWLPVSTVPSMSSRGHSVFEILWKDSGVQPLSAIWLAESRRDRIADAIERLPQAYANWIEIQTERIPALNTRYREQANKHLDDCRKVHQRLLEGVQLIRNDEMAATAFRLANKAMAVQRNWAYPDQTDLKWRPFQLAFILLVLPSICSREHPDRNVMDLLWFPTGGGKTEAYLGLIAFLLFYRRLRNAPVPDRGAGVAAIMRYTLRLLTTQQFQRAAALVVACEQLRNGAIKIPDIAANLGQKQFSIGLWVGRDSVPNDVKSAIAALESGDPNQPSPAQLRNCPACKRTLRWYASPDRTSIRVKCTNRDCLLSGSDLPMWTVDEDVYRYTPALIVGTVDKFAQIARNSNTRVLFGSGASDAPDLILQDELHLISGPLGTITALYETAIDRLCTRGKVKPKVIGSTATIKRAEQQILALFDRRACQFPPAAIDARDSCFAIEETGSPGRLYVGVTTAGRSAKFTIQAVCASLLQSAAAATASESARDPYWTLVAYFNSLRELGGALVLMQDDVTATLAQISERRSELRRAINEVRELTSRVSQNEIRDMLEQLNVRAGVPGAVDVLLATNMISVGVDVPRLGLMVVNGQPKGIAEYIQATSRVGRGDGPGLIVSVYNNAKARDRSHYETFKTWHQTLYREVESNSVTPFASRARDRALHAVLVTLVRHLVADMTDTPVITQRGRAAFKDFTELIAKRAESVDPAEKDGVLAQLELLASIWENRVGLEAYWRDKRPLTSLLISAETAAAARAAGRLPGEAWPTLNNMRNVEPATAFDLRERIPNA